MRRNSCTKRLSVFLAHPVHTHFLSADIIVWRSVLGMHLFGGKFCRHVDDKHVCTCAEITSQRCICSRKNFDTLHWSLVTVFQVHLSRCLRHYSAEETTQESRCPFCCFRHIDRRHHCKRFRLLRHISPQRGLSVCPLLRTAASIASVGRKTKILRQKRRPKLQDRGRSGTDLVIRPQSQRSKAALM